MLLLVDNGSKHTPELKEYLKDRHINFVLAKKNSNLKKALRHRFQGAILSGGPLQYSSNINIEEVNINLVTLLELKVPILGICLGHQTIAEAYGGKVRKMKNTIHKQEKITVVKHCQLFQGLPRSFYMKEYHQDRVYRLPYKFELLAHSTSCHIEAIKHKTKPIYGVQFHPEASKEEGYKLLDNFLKICGYNISKT